MPHRSAKKFQIYKRLYARRQDIIQDAKKLGASIEFPSRLKGKFGLTSAHSSFPGPIAKDVLRVMDRAGDEVRPLSDLNDDLRETVKDYYGDGYDAVPIASGEAALWIAF
jgi:hypothetical protein